MLRVNRTVGPAQTRASTSFNDPNHQIKAGYKSIVQQIESNSSKQICY